MFKFILHIRSRLRVAGPSQKPLVSTSSSSSAVFVEADCRNSGDDINCNDYFTTQHRHESPHCDVKDNTGYADLGDSQVT